MLLAIDVGNTQTVVGQLENDNWKIQRFDTDVDNLTHHLSGLKEYAWLCASVVPSASALITSLNKDTKFLSLNLVPWFRSEYITPLTLGADRLANAIALAENYALPAVALDFGTATKFDAVNSEGIYLGGSIAVGLKTSMHALSQKTAQLPQVSLEGVPSLIGNDTESSIRSGVIIGFGEMIDGLIDRYGQELGDSTSFVATGGLALIALQHIRNKCVLEPLLTLQGIRIAYERLEL